MARPLPQLPLSLVKSCRFLADRGVERLWELWLLMPKQISLLFSSDPSESFHTENFSGALMYSTNSMTSCFASFIPATSRKEIFGMFTLICGSTIVNFAFVYIITRWKREVFDQFSRHTIISMGLTKFVLLIRDFKKAKRSKIVERKKITPGHWLMK